MPLPLNGGFAMSGWDNLRRAKHLVGPKKGVNELPNVIGLLIDEIRVLKRDIKRLKKVRDG